MRRFTMTHEFDCTPETYWKLNFDRDMNTAMYRDGLGFPDYTIQELRETDTTIFRRTVATPKMDLPAAVQRILGSNFRYTEETDFNKSTKVCTFKGIPSVQPEKLKTNGKMSVDALPNNRCRRTIEIVSEANIMLVGGLLEETGEKNIRASYDKSARYTNRWIKEKGLEGP